MTQGNSTLQNAVNQYIQGSGIQGVNYTNPQTSLILKGKASRTEGAEAESGNKDSMNHGLFLTDIAQAHHFTVQIEGLGMSKLNAPNPQFGRFLPVKTINLTYSSYENMSIPVAIFGDFPLLNKKRVSTIALSCYDKDTNDLEREIRLWENNCFPKGRFVAYMEDVAKLFTYKGYNVKGKETFSASFYVIPSGAISVSRDYSANDAKMVNFNLVCVGDGSTCATGNPSPKQVTQTDYKLLNSGKDDRLSGFENRIQNQDIIETPNNNAYYNPDGNNDTPIS